MERSLRLIGHLFFLVFLVFAVVLSDERVLFSDSAYQLFKIINYEQFNIEHSRFPAVFTQLFTLIGVKLHLPLHWLILCFSVSFAVVYYVIYLISVYVYRNTAAGLAIVFVLCLGIRHNYFHIVTETHQALVYSCLFFAWLMRQNAAYFPVDGKQVFNLLIGFIIICLAGFSHPCAYLVMLFCILFFMVEKNAYKSPLSYLMVALVVLLGLIKYATTPSDSYEGHFLDQITRVDEIMKDFLWLPSVRHFVGLLKEMYIYPVLLIIVACLHYLLTGNLKKFILVSAYVSGFMLFTFIIFSDGDSRIMMERAFMPLTLLGAIPFLYDFVLKSSGLKTVKLATVTILLVISLTGIYRTSRYFSERVAYLQQFSSSMDEIKSHKLLIDWNNTTNRLIYMPWAFAVETMLYTAAQDPENAKTVFVYEHIDELNAPLEDKDLFLCVHFDVVWKDEQLNARYFRLPQEAYVVKRDSFPRVPAFIED